MGGSVGVLLLGGQKVHLYQQGTPQLGWCCCSGALSPCFKAGDMLVTSGGGCQVLAAQLLTPDPSWRLGGTSRETTQQQ